MRYLFKNGNKDGYNKRIESVAEKLHKDADKLRSEGEHHLEISWEKFRSNYMRDTPPSDDLEHRIYREKRSNMWKEDVNKM